MMVGPQARRYFRVWVRSNAHALVGLQTITTIRVRVPYENSMLPWCQPFSFPPPVTWIASRIGPSPSAPLADTLPCPPHRPGGALLGGLLRRRRRDGRGVRAGRGEQAAVSAHAEQGGTEAT
eukprot:scaffold10842_cov104-Isochrysis_galbana.AAC.1